MILILEPFEELLEIDLSKKGFTDKNTTKALIKLYKKFLKLPEYFFNQIDELIIINSVASDFYISDKSFRDSIKFIINNNKLDEINRLFNNAQLINIKDNVESSLFINSLIRKYDKAKFLIFDTLLTPSMPTFLTNCDNLYGFRLMKKEDGKMEWRKIDNIQKYIAIGMILFNRQFDLDEMSNQIFNYSRDYQISIIKEILLSIKSGLCKHHMIQFRKSEMDDQNFVLKRLMDDLGHFGIHNIRVNRLRLDPKYDGYIIYDLEKIDEQSRYQFLNSISSEEFREKVIFIVVEQYMDLSEFPRIKFWLELSENRSRTNSEIVFENLLNANRIFTRKLNEYKHIVNFILSDDRIEKRIMIKLDELLSINCNKYDIEKINFWYDLDAMELDEIGNWQKPIAGMIKSVKNLEEEVTTYDITHNKDQGIWEIKKDGEFVNRLNYKTSVGMKYITYLYQYCQQRAIDSTKLREIVNQWNGKQYKFTSIAEDAKVISSALDYFFKTQCPQLSSLYQCLHISPKHPGCFFVDKKNIVVKILDEDIPDPAIS